MNDLNLRQQVAERLGWTDIDTRSGARGKWLVGLTPDNRAPDMDLDRDVIPAYESDIAAAWELVEAMTEGKDVCDVVVNVYPISDDDPDGAYCEIVRWKNYERLPLQSAPTAPAAICKAWLAYMDSKKEQHDGG